MFNVNSNQLWGEKKNRGSLTQVKANSVWLKLFSNTISAQYFSAYVEEIFNSCVPFNCNGVLRLLTMTNSSWKKS